MINNYKKMIIIGTILFFLVTAIGNVSAGTAQSTETQITTNQEDQLNPSIYGNRVIWEDWRNGNADIYMYDFSTSRETRITSSTSGQYWPVIYGNRIVWMDDRNGGGEEDGQPVGNWDIYMYDLSTSKETQITTNKSTQSWPAIYGNRIVWEDGRNGNWDVYMYDLSTSREIRITTNKSNQYEPALYGNRIVWTDERNGNSQMDNTDIYMYDLSTSRETQITNDAYRQYAPDEHYQYSPAIYGNRIVWVSEGSDDHIYMYDLSTKKETHIAYGALDPDIYGDRIVYRGASGSPVYMYNVSTSKEIQISSDGADQFIPAIYGNRIVWEDYRNGNADIYAGTLGSNPLSASFSSNVSSGNVPLTVAFTDTSTGLPTAWNWSFGDGTYSTIKNPVHVYSKAGNYTVSLTVKNAAGSNTATKSNYITVTAPTTAKVPVIYFWASRTSGTAPITIGFTDASTNTPTAWNWSFGDGTYSTLQNPRHTYASAGTYSVTLTASNAAGSATKTRYNYITLTGTTTQKPVASFSSNVTSGNIPLNVAFTDTSTGSPTAWNWNFGDGTTNSTVKNPVHVYSKAGTYTVTLTASNSASSSTVTRSNYITATTSTTAKVPVVSFWASRTSGTVPVTIGFTDASTNAPTAWKWSFGDGTYSTAQNPRHYYSKAGTYSITLTASNAAGSATKTRYNYIILK